MSMMVVVRDHHTHSRMTVTNRDHHGHSRYDGRGLWPSYGTPDGAGRSAVVTIISTPLLGALWLSRVGVLHSRSMAVVLVLVVTIISRNFYPMKYDGPVLESVAIMNELHSGHMMVTRAIHEYYEYT